MGDPIAFMITWLGQKQAGGGAEADRMRLKINALKEDIKELETRLVEQEADEEEEDDDDDVVDDLPPPPVNKGPRTSVSAEAYGKWNQKKEYTPVEIPKAEEAKERIRKVLAGSFLFSAL